MDLPAFLDFGLQITEKFKLTFAHVLGAVVLIIVLNLVLRLLRTFFNKKSLSSDVYVAYKAIKYFLTVAAVIIYLQSIGINLTLLIAGSTALLVGVGIGLQQTFNDVTSGFILLVERSIEIGDVVEINGLVGRVVELGVRTSKIKTRDDITIIVPNSKLVVNQVINWSHEKKEARFFVKVGVDFDSDVELVKQILLDVADNHHQIAKTPSPLVRFEDIGDFRFAFSLFFWTEETFLVEITMSDLRFEIIRKFRENNIKIPFPQQDLFFKNEGKIN